MMKSMFLRLKIQLSQLFYPVAYQLFMTDFFVKEKFIRIDNFNFDLSIFPKFRQLRRTLFLQYECF